MNNVRATFKLFSFALAALCYFFTGLIFYPILLLNPDLGRKLITPILSFYSKLVMNIFNLKTQLLGKDKIKKNQNYLVASNHLSYLDVIILASRFPSCFVTSVEVKKSLFLGQIAQIAGCVFVERRSRNNLSDEIREITDSLRYGLNIVIFPEATSTNGESVLRFKRPLFQAAIDSQKSILPICINYKSVNNYAVSQKNRDLLFWYGDMGFMKHFWNFLKTKKIVAEVSILDEITTSLDQDTTYLSEVGHQIVSRNYICVV